MDESSTQSVGETLSEAQKLNTTKSARAALPVMIAASTNKGYTCAWCQTLFQHASNMTTGEKYIFKCGGGCVQHYLCSNVCMLSDWNDGHRKVCVRGRVVL